MAKSTPSSLSQTVSGQTDSPDAGLSPRLVRSVVSAALFFLPLGIIALVYSLRCQRALDAARLGGLDVGTELEQAAKASRLAYRWSTAAIIVGVGIYLLLITAFLLLGAFT